MKTVHSADGTVIAYDQFGDQGPPVILVAGAFNTRATTDGLARTLQDDCIALNLDRRGRGESGDTAPYSVDREIEDLDALIRAAGAAVLVFGYSSGALLALRAAAARSHIAGLVLYEPPYRPSDAPPMTLPRCATRHSGRPLRHSLTPWHTRQGWSAISHSRRSC